jgi:hypothetical protein
METLKEKAMKSRDERMAKVVGEGVGLRGEGSLPVSSCFLLAADDTSSPSPSSAARSNANDEI